VVKAQTTAAKGRSMVLAANDKAMFVSGDKPHAKKIVVPARAAPKAAAPKPVPQNASLMGMPSERAMGGQTARASTRPLSSST
jgi:hypothetical protein